MGSRWDVFGAVFSVLGLGTRHVVVSAAEPEEGRLPQHPFRGALPARAPRRLSARLVATVLSAGLVATALGVPVLLHRARWVEIEAVLLGWWSVWVLVLAIVAYRGVETADDWTFALSLPEWGVRRRTRTAPRQKRSVLWDILGVAGDVDAVAYLVVVVAVLALAFAGAWMFVEMLVPALFFVAYVALLAALRRIHRYEGSTRAIGAAMVWATAYVGPLALTVWLVHVFATT